jgi:hypothetical protein
MEFKTKAKQSSGGSEKFLKLKDGESVIGVFRGEIYEFHMKWVNNKSTPASLDDPEAKTRFRANIIVPVNGKPVAKIFEFAYPVFEQMANIDKKLKEKKRGGITKVKVDISRMGEGTSTKYMLMVDDAPVNMNAIDQVELHILNKDGAPPIPHSEPPPGYDDFPPPREEDSFEDNPEIPF